MSKFILKSNARRAVTSAWSLALAVMMPILAIILCRVPRVALGNFTDAVFYLSYARQFSELVLRHGFLYYATRFGGILPDAVSGHLFGETDGIWILRWTLSALVSLSLFLSFRKHYGVLSGLVASALWAFNPAALRLSCTTYVDSTAVPFLIIGCCVVAIFPSEAVGLVVAGILFGLASSAHLYAAFALVLLVPWLVGSLWGVGWKKEAQKLSWIAAGFTLTWVLGWLWYTVVWGMPGLLSPTIDLIRDLGNGQAALWKKPILLALHEAPAWFAPIALLPVGCMTAWKGSPLVRGAACSLLMSVFFFWGGDLLGNAYVLSMPFYYSFLLPVTLLTTAVVCGELINRQPSGSVRMLIAGLLVSASMLPTLLARWENVGWIPVTVLVGSAVVLPLIWKKLASRWLLATTLPLIFLSALVVARTGMFSQMLGHYIPKDEPVLEIASCLRGIIPSARSDQETTRLWYDDDPGKPGGSDRRMIGSFWLHYFGKFTGKDGNYIPFGEMDDANATAISENGPDRMIIFDQDPKKVEGAVSVIREKGLPFGICRREHIEAASDKRRTLDIAILERVHPALSTSRSAELPWHQMHRGRSLSTTGENKEFLSSRIKWWDPLAEADLGSLQEGDRIEFPYIVRSGRIRFSLGEKGKEPMVTVEKWPSDNEAKLELTVPADMNDAVISIRNRNPTGSNSRIRVGGAQIVRNGGNP